MDEQRIQAYVGLNQQLLGCAQREEVTLLQANAGLLDAGLLAVMGQYADLMEANGDRNAGWLRQFAGQLAQMHGGLEIGVEKLAIYATSDGRPQHVARQLPSGLWTSKLGRLEDIEHELEGVKGELYGMVWVFMRRAAWDEAEALGVWVGGLG